MAKAEPHSSLTSLRFSHHRLLLTTFVPAGRLISLQASTILVVTAILATRGLFTTVATSRTNTRQLSGTLARSLSHTTTIAHSPYLDSVVHHLVRTQATASQSTCKQILRSRASATLYKLTRTRSRVLSCRARRSSSLYSASSACTCNPL